MLLKNLNTLGRLFRAIRPEVEKLEERQLLSADPLAYQNVVQTLPYALNFSERSERRVRHQRPGAPGSPSFSQQKRHPVSTSLVYLNTAIGELNLTTTGNANNGSSNGTDNTQVNALEKNLPPPRPAFPSPRAFRARCRISPPTTKTAASFSGPTRTTM